MKKGTPIDFDECSTLKWRTKCQCEFCSWCGNRKHTSVHGGVIGHPGMVWGHEFVPQDSKARND